MQDELSLTSGDCHLQVAPSLGGAIRRFDWRGMPVLRPSAGESILDAACFPLVPFSNRIARGQFDWNGRQVVLKPNFPGSDHPHPLHGFGWLSPWTVLRHEPDRVVLEHHHHADEWPWSCRAELEYVVFGAGLRASLMVTNLADVAMPAGVGFHPYYPRTAKTVYRALHRGEYRNDADCLPVTHQRSDQPRDWWGGAPVGSRIVDTVYSGSERHQSIEWPDRGMSLRIESSPSLDFTAVLVPADTDWFCVEPVSHATNAVNSRAEDTGLCSLEPGESLRGTMTLTVVPQPGRGI